MGKIMAAIGVSFVVITLITVVWIIGIKNECVTQEAGIKAQYGQNQNNYDNYFKSVKEVAQVPTMYTSDLKKVYDSAISGRYGKRGSSALFQFIKEHNPTFDASLYHQVQQVIEAGRKGFEIDQKTLLDKKRIYEQTLGSTPDGDIAKAIFGFPRIDLVKYDIVTSEETETIFKTKKSAPLTIR